MAKRKYKKTKARLHHHSIDSFYVFLAIFFIVYQILSSTFIFLSPLLGLFFCYMYILLEEKENLTGDLDFRWLFSLFYLTFIDINHNFFLFSSIASFFIFLYFCADWIKINFKIGSFVCVPFVVYSYILVYGLDSVLSYVNGTEMKSFDYIYLFYIFIDSTLSYVFFRDKIK